VQGATAHVAEEAKVIMEAIMKAHFMTISDRLQSTKNLKTRYCQKHEIFGLRNMAVRQEECFDIDGHVLYHQLKLFN